ncbi:MAG TPA: HD domain-containing phosphohydrolase [Ruminiclostridium sp.]
MKSRAGIAEIIGIVCVAMFLGLIAIHVLLFRAVSKVSYELTTKNIELEGSKKQVEGALRKLHFSYMETVTAASAAIDARDSYTAGHSNRVADIACKVGRQLGLDYTHLKCLELAALLHDIGKIGIPDGKGYPEGLKGDQIPIGASIIAIADTYDAMTSDRPYRRALSHESAVGELKKHSGTQLKKEVVEAFLRLNIS